MDEYHLTQRLLNPVQDALFWPAPYAEGSPGALRFTQPGSFNGIRQLGCLASHPNLRGSVLAPFYTRGCRNAQVTLSWVLATPSCLSSGL